jgi:competence protein ComEA
MARKKQQQIFKPKWKDQFTFSLRERRGFFVLIIILALEAGLLYYLRFIYRPTIEPQWLQLINKADSLHHLLLKDSLRVDKVDFSAAASCVKSEKDSLFQFNPNACGTNDLKRLGLSERQAQVFLHYRAAIGKFRIKGDLKKVKVISSELFDRWQPYIDLPETLDAVQAYHQPAAILMIDLCVADSTAFEKLKGIGPTLSGRIVKYRNRLGGFSCVEQLKEVYGLNDTLFVSVCKQTSFRGSCVQRLLQLNSSPEDSLRQHPYIGYKLSRQIVRYREQHPFHQVSELITLPLVTPEIYRKLAPYLDVR